MGQESERLQYKPIVGSQRTTYYKQIISWILCGSGTRRATQVNNGFCSGYYTLQADATVFGEQELPEKRKALFATCVRVLNLAPK